MAVVECIPEKSQNPSAQKGVIDYCMQPSKTLDEGEQLAYVSGINCIPELAQESFLATQKHFGCKTGAVRFYHYVQSFKPEEKLSPQQAHDIGLEFAQSFGNREVIVATHIDRDHLHNHFVVCAYDLESGLKIHNNKFYLSDLRKRSDQICQAHGLTTLSTYNPNVKSQRLGPKEYRAAVRGNSWKMELRVAIDYCMARSRSKSEFKKEMKKLGYNMVYTPERKYITYILRAEDGQEKRVRDIKLNEEKYRKENMEREFKIRAELYGQAEGTEYAVRPEANAGNASRSDGADQRRGMEAADAAGATFGSPVGRPDGTEGRYGAGHGNVHGADSEGGTDADGGDEGSNREDLNRSRETGWESERESLASYLESNRQGRSALVASAGAHGSTGDLGAALVGVRGVANLVNLFEDNTEETEEERKERQAQNAAVAAGLALGAATALIQHTLQKDETIGEDPCDNKGWNFSLSM